MATKVFERDETVYDIDGHAYEYICKSDAGHIVAPVMTLYDDYGETYEETSTPILIDKEIYSNNELHPKIESKALEIQEKIKGLQHEQERLREEIRSLQGERRALTTYSKEEENFIKFINLVNPLIEANRRPLYFVIAPYIEYDRYTLIDIIEYDPCKHDKKMAIQFVYNNKKWSAEVQIINDSNCVKYTIAYIETDLDKAKQKREEVYIAELDRLLTKAQDKNVCHKYEQCAYSLLRGYAKTGFEHLATKSTYQEIWALARHWIMSWYQYNEREVSRDKEYRLNEIEKSQTKLEKQKEELEAFQVLFEKLCG